MSRALSTNNYGPAKFIVASSASNGTHTTIASALTDASSGDTIFIRPGTYTENLTLKAGVLLTAFPGDGYAPNVIILGNATASGAGTFTIGALQLKTNGSACLTVSGSSATVVYLNNVFINCNDSTGISYTTSNASSSINILNCTFQLATTGIAYYSMSSTGSMDSYRSDFENAGGSTTASSNSAGSVGLFNCVAAAPFSTSSTGNISFINTYVNTQNQNATCITTAGSGALNFLFNSFISSGSASSVSIGAGTTLGSATSTISSSNANAITGAGTITYSDVAFTGSSQKINTTTQTGGTTKGGQTQAPSAGFIGEQISSTATSVATTNSTPKTITSISVTAGIWDISGSFGSQPTGGTGIMSGIAAGISTTDNTLGATLGINYIQLSVAALSTSAFTVPIVRATLTGTTTYYLVVNNVYSSTTCPTNALITATRVG